MRKPKSSLWLVLGMSLATIAGAQSPYVASDGPTPLPPVDVEGERGPLDSQRPRYEAQTPCLGTCEEAVADRSRLLVVAESLIVPIVPPEDRHDLPISLRQSRNRNAHKLP